jgi:hypothetical protein
MADPVLIALPRRDQSPLRIDRLLRRYVEPGCEHNAILHRVVQRIDIDHGAARRVDQDQAAVRGGKASALTNPVSEPPASAYGMS